MQERQGREEKKGMSVQIKENISLLIKDVLGLTQGCPSIEKQEPEQLLY